MDQEVETCPEAETCPGESVSASLTDLASRDPAKFPFKPTRFSPSGPWRPLRRACTCRYVGPTAVARLVLVNREGGAWWSADLLPQHALASSRLQLGKPAGVWSRSGPIGKLMPLPWAAATARGVHPRASLRSDRRASRPSLLRRGEPHRRENTRWRTRSAGR